MVDRGGNYRRRYDYAIGSYKQCGKNSTFYNVYQDFAHPSFKYEPYGDQTKATCNKCHYVMIG